MSIYSVLNAAIKGQAKTIRATNVLPKIETKALNGVVDILDKITTSNEAIQKQRIKAHYQPRSDYPIFVDLQGGYGMDLLYMKTNLFINSHTYTGPNYQVAERIQQLRLQLLIHSRLYYELDRNIWMDGEWDARAYELVNLQAEYLEDSKLVVYYEAFETWDATTGCMLPLNDPWVVRKTEELLKAKNLS